MSLADDVVKYYAARAPVYDETAGFADVVAEKLRDPIKARYREMFRGHDVLEVACGSGYWTAVVGETAKSVLATDINPPLLAAARDRCRDLHNVSFQLADAHALDCIPAGFTAAFAVWWWSHVPRELLRRFLSNLHGRLTPGGLVFFSDQLQYEGDFESPDAAGNTLERRMLPGGRTFRIVKNFPTESEIRRALSGMAKNVRYVERAGEKHWDLVYNTIGSASGSRKTGRR